MIGIVLFLDEALDYGETTLVDSKKIKVAKSFEKFCFWYLFSKNKDGKNNFVYDNIKTKETNEYAFQRVGKELIAMRIIKDSINENYVSPDFKTYLVGFDNHFEDKLLYVVFENEI